MRRKLESIQGARKVSTGAVAVYLLLRLPNLSGFPLFNDEAIYTRWAILISEEPSQLFLSLIDGKPPLSYWVYAIFVGLIPNPVWATRLVSVLVGLLSMIVLGHLARRLFGSSVVPASLTFYLLCPFFMFYDRMALTESFVQLWSILVFWEAVLLAEKPSVRRGLMLGLFLGSSGKWGGGWCACY